MSFITNRTKANFYNESQMTFSFRRIVWISSSRLRRVCISQFRPILSEGRLLLACDWGHFGID